MSVVHGRASEVLHIWFPHLHRRRSKRPPILELAASLEQEFGVDLGRGSEALCSVSERRQSQSLTLLCGMHFMHAATSPDTPRAEKMTKAWMVIVAAPLLEKGRRGSDPLLPMMVVLGHIWEIAHGAPLPTNPSFSSARPILTADGVAAFIQRQLEAAGHHFTGADILAFCPAMARALGWVAGPPGSALMRGHL